MVSHQEQLLHLAMRSDLPSEYERLHKGFENFLRNSGRYWQLDSESQQEAEEVSDRLDQHYRITLMGLGGRAVLLAESRRIADGGLYLEVVRGKHVRLENLANDLAQALAREEVREKSLWSDWEMEGALNFETRGVYPERYPLTWFAIRLMELAAEPLTAIDLHGQCPAGTRVVQCVNSDKTCHLCSWNICPKNRGRSETCHRCTTWRCS